MINISIVIITITYIFRKSIQIVSISSSPVCSSKTPSESLSIPRYLNDNIFMKHNYKNIRRPLFIRTDCSLRKKANIYSLAS